MQSASGQSQGNFHLPAGEVKSPRRKHWAHQPSFEIMLYKSK